LRFGSVGAVGSNLVVATAAIIGLAFDVGAFETFSPFNREQALGAQLFLAVIGVTSMIAGAVSAERRLVEHSLRASQERLADAQRVARLGSWTVAFTPGGDVWTVSDELHRIWGEPPGTPATTESGFERIHPDDRARVADVWTAAIQSRVPSQWDQRILVGGDERWIAVHARVERTPDGQPVTMTGTNQDITDRKRIETELRATEAKYRLVTENASDVIWLLDVESGRFVYVSPSVEKLRGYSPEEVMALPAEAALTSASQDRVKQTMADHLARFFAGNSPGGPIITLVDQPTKGGTVVPTEVTTRYVRDESSGRVYAVGISRDISERCVTEGRLANLASEQATVLNTVPATIWCAIERKIVWTNPAMLDLLGYTPDEAIGMGVDPFYASRTDYDDVGQHGYAAMARGETFSCEVLMRRKSGDDVWCHLAGRYIDPADRARGAIWVIQDITARKLAEQQLRSSADAQRVLLREVNHRVKNNLSALLAMVHMEQDRAVVEGQPAVKRTMSDLDARLRSLATVHAILSFSEWRPVRLDDLCSRLIAQVIGASAGHLRNLQVTESQVVVDANQAQSLALVVSELATNTLKYGADPGQPSIWVSIAQSDTQVFLTYRDRGPGFPPTVLSGGGTATNVGLELVGGLVHQTLRGRVTMSNDAGAVVSIEFPAASPKGQES
jgi:PAS domain S-box-containing protein